MTSQNRAPFVNRNAEIEELNALSQKGGLIVVFGRRRIGKSRLLVEWVRRAQGAYVQCIESSPEMQLQQVFSDLKNKFNFLDLVPKSWEELFAVLDLQKKPLIIVIDEFPYLVESDSSLPSRFQKWLDHRQGSKLTLVLSGSSQRMMHHEFLNPASPLYGRARKILNVGPMDYSHFCKVTGLSPNKIETFECFSMTGGIPKYWEWVDSKVTPVELAERLYFGASPYMEFEPRRVLSDEKLEGMSTLSILEAIGRGANRPNEIAGRVQTPQTSLSKPLQLLLEAHLIVRELPFGENIRSSKKVLYKIADPSLSFWFHVYSPHRSRWYNYDQKTKANLIHEHASKIFEEISRQSFKGASRYWEGGVEMDWLVEEKGQIWVMDAKFKKVTAPERASLLKHIEQQWSMTKISKKYPKVQFKVFDWSSFVERIAKLK